MQQTALDFEQSRAVARRNAGMSSAARHADAENPGWVDLAIDAVHAFAMRTYPQDFTIEEARAVVAPTIPEPSELRAWGAVTSGCKRRMLIEAVEGKTRPAASSNGSPKQVYRLRRTV